MTRPAIQMYTLRDVDRSLTEILELVDEAGFEGVEFTYHMTETDLDPGEIVETLEETGLEYVGAHVAIDALEDDFDETATLHEQLTTEDLVVPYLGVEHFDSYEAVQDVAGRLERLATDLDKHGMSFHYHNHDHEFVELSDETGFDALLDRTDFGIELDLGMALKGGEDPVSRLRSLGDRSKLVYLRDFDVEEDEAAPLGEGDLDLDGVADAIRKNDSDWLIFEYEGDDPLEALEDAAETVGALCS